MVGHLDAQVGLAGYWRFHAQAARGQRKRKVIGQRDDAPDARAAEHRAAFLFQIFAKGLDGVARDSWANLHVHDFYVDVEFEQSVLEQDDVAVDLFCVGWQQGHIGEQLQWRQLLAALPDQAFFRIVVESEIATHTAIRSLHQTHFAAPPPGRCRRLVPGQWHNRGLRSVADDGYGTHWRRSGRSRRVGRHGGATRRRQVGRIGTDANNVEFALLP